MAIRSPLYCSSNRKLRFRDLFHIRTLRQRLILFLLVPVTFLLFGSGLMGFIYVRNAYLSQWQETALLKLERAAHHIDMRLEKPMALIGLFESTARDQNTLIATQILDRIRKLPGVTDVLLENQSGDAPPFASNGPHGMGHGMMRFDRVQIATITQPTYDPIAGRESISLVSLLLDAAGAPVGRLEIKIRFDFLMAGIRTLGWQQSDMAALIDDTGRHLLHIVGSDRPTRPLANSMDSPPVEPPEVLEAIRTKSSGTLLGPGSPPETVIGYHRLEKAPWSLVLEARGANILAPITRLQILFSAGSLIVLLFILLLIRTNVGRIVGSICMLAGAAQNVARGHYGDPIPVESSDEIGHLVDSYNRMVEGLKERDFVRNTFGRYVDEDVARELLSHPSAVRLGGDRREVAILMSDIRGFTPLAETLSPEAAIQMLNTYFGHMIEAIKVHHGIIVDFVGDALLAFFDPLEKPIQTSAARGVTCALDMQARMAQFNREIQGLGLAPVEIGIGVHVGAVVVGNIGSETRAKYGIVGAAVNLTQRIEGKARGGETLISETCYRLLSDQVAVGRPVREVLKGVLDPIDLYPVRKLKVRPQKGASQKGAVTTCAWQARNAPGSGCD